MFRIWCLLDVGFHLVGGFKYFLFLPLLGEDSHFDEYFSNGLKPQTSHGNLHPGDIFFGVLVCLKLWFSIKATDDSMTLRYRSSMGNNHPTSKRFLQAIKNTKDVFFKTNCWNGRCFGVEHLVTVFCVCFSTYHICALIEQICQKLFLVPLIGGIGDIYIYI